MVCNKDRVTTKGFMGWNLDPCSRTLASKKKEQRDGYFILLIACFHAGWPVKKKKKHDLYLAWQKPFHHRRPILPIHI